MKSMVIKISKNKIIELEMSDVLSELSIVNDRIQQMEQKYHCSFEEFQKEVEEADDEDFEKYDDLIVWEGYEESKSYLETRLEELKNAEDIVITE